MADNQVEVSTEIRCDADRLYDMVADLPNMGRWSPEARGGRWIRGGGPELGARFLGTNGVRWRRWATTAKVTEAERGKRFAFHVTSGGMKVADWSYDFVSRGDTTVVTERWVDRRVPWFRTASAVVTGVSDRVETNRQNMSATLEALKRGAEGGS